MRGEWAHQDDLTSYKYSDMLGMIVNTISAGKKIDAESTFKLIEAQMSKTSTKVFWHNFP